MCCARPFCTTWWTLEEVGGTFGPRVAELDPWFAQWYAAWQRDFADLGELS